MDALRTKFNTSSYLLRMVRRYLGDRKFIYDSAGGPCTKKITVGATQDSIRGPDLWNVTNDAILRIELP